MAKQYDWGNWDTRETTYTPEEWDAIRHPEIPVKKTQNGYQVQPEAPKKDMSDNDYFDDKAAEEKIKRLGLDNEDLIDLPKSKQKANTRIKPKRNYSSTRPSSTRPSSTKKGGKMLYSKEYLEYERDVNNSRSELAPQERDIEATLAYNKRQEERKKRIQDFENTYSKGQIEELREKTRKRRSDRWAADQRNRKIFATEANRRYLEGSIQRRNPYSTKEEKAQITKDYMHNYVNSPKLRTPNYFPKMTPLYKGK